MNEITAKEAARFLDGLTEIVSRAAASIMATPLAQVARRTKADESPVTSADELSQAVILEGLAKLLPGLPVVAEEQVERTRVQHDGSFAIVDPLDGTKGFIAGRDEFAVNVAIVSAGTPVVGVIAAPAQGLLWRAAAGGNAERMRLDWNAGPTRASECRIIKTRLAPARLVAVTSRNHLDARTKDFLARLPLERQYQSGSSVKFGHLAQGDADVYPRLAPVSEWDVAAGCVILAAAGGIVTDPQGMPLRFGRAQDHFRVPSFVAWGDPAKAAIV